MNLDDIFSGIDDNDFLNHSGYDGVADCNDMLWRKSMLIQRNISRLGSAAVPGLIDALDSESFQVKNFAIKFLGIHQCKAATDKLIDIMEKQEEIPGHGILNACEAAIALGRIGGDAVNAAFDFIDETYNPSEIRNRTIVARKLMNAVIVPPEDILNAYSNIDESDFRLLIAGEKAPSFNIFDTNGKLYSLENIVGGFTVLIWIFAEWCPACHGEFDELEEMEREYKKDAINVFTVQVGDVSRCRLMAEMHSLWWPHLVDTAGAFTAMYCADPFEYTVHSEWINRPATIIINGDGIVEYAYYGTFFGDRPKVKQIYEMIRKRKFDFEYSHRKKI